MTYHRDVLSYLNYPFSAFKQVESECLPFSICCIGLWDMFRQINKTGLSFTCNILNNTVLVDFPKFITGTRHSLWFPGILAQTSQQSIKLGNHSFTMRLSTDAPQEWMLSLQIYYYLYTAYMTAQQTTPPTCSLNLQTSPPPSNMSLLTEKRFGNR